MECFRIAFKSLVTSQVWKQTFTVFLLILTMRLTQFGNSKSHPCLSLLCYRLRVKGHRWEFFFFFFFLYHQYKIQPTNLTCQADSINSFRVDYRKCEFVIMNLNSKCFPSPEHYTVRYGIFTLFFIYKKYIYVIYKHIHICFIYVIYKQLEDKYVIMLCPAFIIDHRLVIFVVDFFKLVWHFKKAQALKPQTTFKCLPHVQGLYSLTGSKLLWS